LTEEDNIKIIAVVDFPDGLMKYEKKLSDVIDAISNGVEEIDLTINVEEIKEIYKNENDEEKEKEYNVIVEDLKTIADECHKNGVILKLIIETGILSLTELIDVCNIVYKAGIDFIQTSTGMKGNGAELSKLKELRRLLPEYVKIKASGGIRTIEDAKKMLPYVDRIGTSVILT
jgi:deoxyribose-phosphate aldolase